MKERTVSAVVMIVLILLGAISYFVCYTSWSEEASYELQTID